MTTQTPIAAELPDALQLAACFDDNTSIVGAKRIAAELRRQHALLNEQQRTIEALNACINGEGSTTTDNLRLVDRLQAENEALRARGAAPPCQWAHKGCDTPNYCESVQRCTARDSVRAQPAGAATPAAPLNSLELMKVVMVADEALVGRCTRGTTNWAAAIGKAVQDAVLAAAPQPPAAAGAVDALRTAAQAVVDRWDTPLWKDAPATAEYIGMLRAALAAQRATHQGDHK